MKKFIACMLLIIIIVSATFLGYRTAWFKDWTWFKTETSQGADNSSSIVDSSSNEDSDYIVYSSGNVVGFFCLSDIHDGYTLRDYKLNSPEYLYERDNFVLVNEMVSCINNCSIVVDYLGIDNLVYFDRNGIKDYQLKTISRIENPIISSISASIDYGDINSSDLDPDSDIYYYQFIDVTESDNGYIIQILFKVFSWEH